MTLLPPSSILLFFLRFCSLIYLGLAIWVWLDVLGVRDGVGYTGMTDSRQFEALFFCILYPIVSVGLWTTLLWGRIIWYLMSMVHIFLYLFFVASIFLLLLDLLLILIFVFLLTFLRRFLGDVSDVVSG